MMDKLAIILIATSILSGCATFNSEEDSKNMVVTNTPQKLAIEEIKDIAVEARDELRLLAKYQQALASKSLTEEQHRQKFFQSVYIPDGFEQEVDLNIQDRAAKVARAISTIAGYDFDIVGSPTVTDPMININIQNQPLNEALKELGMQTGGLMNIEVYPAARLMVLNYISE